jgi:hypothetical protein
MARIETGPLQIDDDWPGVFIRGDNALMGFAPALEALIGGRASPIQQAACRSLLKVLRSSAAGHEADPIPLQFAKS